MKSERGDRRRLGCVNPEVVVAGDFDRLLPEAHHRGVGNAAVRLLQQGRPNRRLSQNRFEIVAERFEAGHHRCDGADRDLWFERFHSSHSEATRHVRQTGRIRWLVEEHHP